MGIGWTLPEPDAVDRAANIAMPVRSWMPSENRTISVDGFGCAARTGVFTSGIVSTGQGRKIALCFTGSRHAGENLADVLKRRSAELPGPIQMCDALSRNVPRLVVGTEILLANCLAHGRRKFVDVAENFPRECRNVLEMLGLAYGYDAEAHDRGLTPDERLQLHR